MALMTTAPGRKLPYDKDGSIVRWQFNGGTVSTGTSIQLAYLNDEEFVADSITMGIAGNSEAGNIPALLVVMFPCSFNIYRYFIYLTSHSDVGTNQAVSISSIQVSTDTTDGNNGTWTTLTKPSPIGLRHVFVNDKLSEQQWFDDSRVSGTLTGATAIKAIRFNLNTNQTNYYSTYYYLNTLNLWGAINDSSATRRLAWTDSSGTELTNDLAYSGQRSSSNISSLYLKNLYTSATSQIVFSIDGECTTVNSNVTISVDGGTTYNALPYTWTTSLAASTVSSEIKVKYDVSASETYGQKYFNIQALPTYV